MKFVKKIAIWVSQRNFARKAIVEKADLKAFKEKMTPRIITGNPRAQRES